jgi:hypothetical protein
MSMSGEWRGEKQVTPNLQCVPPQTERHAVMCHVSTRATNLRREEVVRDCRSVGGHASTDHVLQVKALQEKASKEKLRIEISESRRFEVNCSHLIHDDMR